MAKKKNQKQSSFWGPQPYCITQPLPLILAQKVVFSLVPWISISHSIILVALSLSPECLQNPQLLWEAFFPILGNWDNRDLLPLPRMLFLWMLAY